MTVSHEIEAIESMGIDPLKYIVFPRIAGGMIAMTCLTVYFSAVGILGGFLVGSLFINIQFSRFFEILWSSIQMTDVLLALLKSILFGAVISTVSIYYGFKINLSSTEVPQAVTRAVVSSLIYIFIIDGIITALFYL
ncbi:MAG: ABC transporter permease, partial [bacterium]|nr:ABC transporter permease [bacterium]